MSPRLLDLFCGAGGAAMGYYRAGFEVVGIDIKPQKRYPFEFHQADALEYLAEHGREYDAIHASPPCQAHTVLRVLHQDRLYTDLIPQTREILTRLNKPFIIENVPGAKTLKPLILLCGTMFRLQSSCGAELRRHRYFEVDFPVGMVPVCQHGLCNFTLSVHGGTTYSRPRTITVAGHSGGASNRDSRHFGGVKARREAMGIEWMSHDELAQAIPPAYTEWIGRQLMEII